jgi:hypothetical protein
MGNGARLISVMSINGVMVISLSDIQSLDCAMQGPEKYLQRGRLISLEMRAFDGCVAF